MLFFCVFLYKQNQKDYQREFRYLIRKNRLRQPYLTVHFKKCDRMFSAISLNKKIDAIRSPVLSIITLLEWVFAVAKNFTLSTLWSPSVAYVYQFPLRAFFCRANSSMEETLDKKERRSHFLVWCVPQLSIAARLMPPRWNTIAGK